MADDGGVGDARGGRAHQHLNLGKVLAHQRGQPLFDLGAHCGRGQRQAIVAIDGALDAAGPGEGLVGAEDDGLNAQKSLCNLLFHGNFLHKLNLRRIRAWRGDRPPRDPRRR